MYFFYDPMYSAVQILTESENSSVSEERKIQAVLEDVNSPVTSKYIQKLYSSVIDKSHVDFDTIPLSKGNIVEYTGYTNMIQVLENILKIASDDRQSNVVEYVNVVKDAINYLRILAPLYQKGFSTGNDYIITEYNAFVYTTVQATSTLLYEFVDYVKRPDSQIIQITLKNTKYRANTFYIDQLRKFNHINKKMQYRKYLETVLKGGKDNFIGTAEIVGFAAVAAIALAIVPVTRELVYRFYNVRASLSDCLAQHAYFLEMNKTVVEANTDFTPKKKEQIIIKQEKIKNICLKLSDKLRVSHIKAVNAGKNELQKDNRLLTLDNIKQEVNDSPLTLL